MALLQRQPFNLSQNLGYTISSAKRTALIIGLGNPGKNYTNSRHNIGFMSLDNFALKNEFGPWQESSKFKALISEKILGSTKVILLKPTTFMNLSGEAAQSIVNFYKIPLESIVAVYDELSIPFGQIRTRLGGQSAGHNGVKSLSENIGPGYGRVRIGIKNAIAPKAEAADFVLGKFTKDEQKQLPVILNEVNSILTEYIFGGKLSVETRRIDIRG